jgi:hypothetical protein
MRWFVMPKLESTCAEVTECGYCTCERWTRLSAQVQHPRQATDGQQVNQLRACTEVDARVWQRASLSAPAPAGVAQGPARARARPDPSTLPCACCVPPRWRGGACVRVQMGVGASEEGKPQGRGHVILRPSTPRAVPSFRRQGYEKEVKVLCRVSECMEQAGVEHEVNSRVGPR